MAHLSRTDRATFLSLLPGADAENDITRVRKIGGGLSARVFLVTIRGSQGTRRVVLRQQDPGGYAGSPETTAREACVIELVRGLGVPAPKVLLADPDGGHFGAPALVLSYEGEPLVTPQREDRWLAQLAAALARIHGITAAEHDLSFLPSLKPAALVDLIQTRLGERRPGDALAGTVLRVLHANLVGIRPLPATLVHRDFHPGNVVWRRSKLTAVVDWTLASVGDRRIDVAQCHNEVAIIHGFEAAAGFVAAYAAAAGQLPDLWFFDLIRGAQALMFVDSWLPAYAEQGLQLSLAEAQARAVAFVEQALASVPA